MNEHAERLRERDRWVCWTYETRDGEETKPPIAPFDGNRYASTSDPETWRSYEEALAYHERDDTDTEGVGYMLGDEDLVAGADLDGCRDPETGEIEPWAQEVIDRLNSYTEVSPSETGLRVFVFALMPDGGNRKGQPRTIEALDDYGKESELEMYDTGRYLTFTGNHVERTPTTVEQRNDAFAAIHTEYIRTGEEDDEQSTLNAVTNGHSDDDGTEVTVAPSGGLDDEVLTKKARNAENGRDFADLWNGDTSGYDSQSEADLALCSHLRFWTGGDRFQMDRLFRQSDLMREKWDEDRGDQTYGERTLQKALSGGGEVYEPGSSDIKPLESSDENGSERLGVTDVVDHALDEHIVYSGDLVYRLDQGALTERHHLNPRVDPHDEDNDHSPDDEDVYKGFPSAKPLLETLLDIEAKGETHGYDTEAIAWTWVDFSEHSTRDRRRHAAWVLLEVCDDIHFATPRALDYEKVPLYVYRDEWGYYEDTGYVEVSQIIARHSGAMDTADIKETVNRIKRETIIDRDAFDAGHYEHELINLANGVYDLTDDELREHDPKYYFRTHIPRTYDEDAERPDAILDFLDEVVATDAERDTLLEWLGFCLKIGYSPHKFLLIHGEGGNGKGVYLEILKRFLDGPNVSHVGMNAMTTEASFEPAQLDGKLANISADAPGKRLTAEETEMIKKLSGGDETQVQRKFQEPFDLYNRAKITIAANEPPRFYGTTDAIPRRLLAIEFPYKFTYEKDDGHKDKIKEEDLYGRLFTDAQLDGLLMEAIDTYRRLEERDQFSIEIGTTDQERFEAYMSDADSIQGFASRCLMNEPEIAIPKNVIYSVYTRYCRRRNVPATKKGAFFRELARKTDIDVYDSQPRIDLPDGRTRPTVLKRLSFTKEALSILTEAERADSAAVTNHLFGRNVDPAMFLDPDADTSEESNEEESAAEDESAATAGDGDSIDAMPIAALEAEVAAQGPRNPYRTVTVHVNNWEIGPENGPAELGTVEDRTGAVDVVDFNGADYNGAALEEGKCYVIRKVKVGTYQGALQLVLTNNTTEVSEIQAGVGYTEVPDSGANQRLEAAADGGRSSIDEESEKSEDETTDALDATTDDADDSDDDDGDALDLTATQTVATVVTNEGGMRFVELRSKLGTDHGLDPEHAETAIERAIEQGRVVRGDAGHIDPV